MIDQDLLRNRLHRLTGGDYLAVNSFRIAAVLAIAIPYLAWNFTGSLSLADTVGLAFAVAASTFCPLLVLGIWWRRMSTVGAAAGLLVGGVAAISAVLVNVIGPPQGGWLGALIAQPAAWTMPLAFATVIVVSRMTPTRIPAGPPAAWSACTPPRPSTSIAASPAPDRRSSYGCDRSSQPRFPAGREVCAAERSTPVGAVGAG